MPKSILLFTILSLALTGCASRWDNSKFDLSRLRDPRATDLDQRLSARPESVSNPFGAGEGASR